MTILLFGLHYQLLLVIINIVIAITIASLFAFLVLRPRGSKFIQAVMFVTIGVILAVSVRQILAYAAGYFGDLDQHTTQQMLQTSAKISNLVGSAFILFGAYKMFRYLSNPELRQAITKSERRVLDSFFERPVLPSSKRIETGTPGTVFANEIGIPYDQLAGERILVEFDPLTDYQSRVNQFIKESLISGQSTVVFTRVGSELSKAKNVKLVLFSVREKPLIELIPSGDLIISVSNRVAILEAFNKIFETYRKVTIIIDNVSNLIMNIGFENTFNLLQLASEQLGESTLLLLMNPKAHDEKVTMAIEDFANAVFRVNEKGISIVRT